MGCIKGINRIGEKEFYLDKFKYNKEENIYICPPGEKFYSGEQKPIEENNTKEIVYRNYEACDKCKFKDKCTKNGKGNDSASNLVVFGKWLYYTNEDKGRRLYRINTDGSGRKKIK